MPGVGFEPTCPHGQPILSRPRIPFRHPGARAFLRVRRALASQPRGIGPAGAPRPGSNRVERNSGVATVSQEVCRTGNQMESSVLKTSSLPLPGLRGPSPLLRLAPDERLVALVRRGQQAAFEAIVSRYQARLLAFSRHMLASREDAEDVLQEVFAAAFNAILADDREINLRPWLYRIARNRCLNHLRRQTAVGVDSMDVHFADAGQSTVEKAAGREDFRLLMADIRRLPETQRTALLLREMDALSYEQIAEAMETTVPGVKSLLVRARVALGEAAEARKLTCAEVRLELAAIAEGISSTTAPLRRHVKDCQRCREFRVHLRANNRVLAAALPVGPILLLKKIALAKLGLSAGAGGASGGSAAASGGAAAGAATAAGGAAAAGGIGAASGGFAGAAVGGTLAAKAVAGLAAAALVTAGAAVETRQAPHHHIAAAAAVAQLRPVRPLVPAVATSVPQPTTTVHLRALPAAPARVKPAPKPVADLPAATVVAIPVAATPTPPAPAPTVQQISSSSVLPPQPTGSPADPAGPAAAAPVQVIIQSGATPPAPPTAPTPPPSAPTAPAPPVSAEPLPAAAAPAPQAAAPPATGTSGAAVPGGTVVLESGPPAP